MISWQVAAVVLVVGVTLAAPPVARPHWDDLNPADRWHKYLTAEEVEGKRIMFVGDVHGCYDEMMSLLQLTDTLNADGTGIANDAIVVFVGDMVNKGPYSLEVLRWVKGSGATSTTGNHEVNVLEKGDEYDWVANATTEDLEYLASLPWTVTVDIYGVTCVHAGLLPDIPLEEQEEYTMTRMRNVIEEDDGSLTASEDTDQGENWGVVWQGPHHVPYGHDAGRGQDQDGNPMIQEHEYATGLDTRCVYGGELSAYMIYPDGRRVVYSVQCEEYDTFNAATQDM